MTFEITHTNPNFPNNPRYNLYKGARYVPKFSDQSGSVWTNTIKYEPLTIVLWEGNSYTSKTFVPVGVDISNETYWAQTGNYNVQMEQILKVIQNITPTVDELEKNYGIISTSQPVNVLLLGMKNDGSEDCTDLINEYTQQFSLFFPEGIYRVDSPIVPVKSLIGAKPCGYLDNVSPNYINGSKILCGDTFSGDYLITPAFNLASSNLVIENLYFDTNHKCGGMMCQNSYYQTKIIGCSFVTTGFNGLSLTGGSHAYEILNTRIEAYEPKTVNIGIFINSPDALISNIFIGGFQTGIHNETFIYGDNIHIWCGSSSPNGEWWAGTNGVVKGSIMIDNLYLDTCAVGLNLDNNSTYNISNFNYADDGQHGGSTASYGIIISNKGSVNIGNVYAMVDSYHMDAFNALANLTINAMKLNFPDNLQLPSEYWLPLIRYGISSTFIIRNNSTYNLLFICGSERTYNASIYVNYQLTDKITVTNKVVSGESLTLKYGYKVINGLCYVYANNTSSVIVDLSESDKYLIAPANNFYNFVNSSSEESDLTIVNP